MIAVKVETAKCETSTGAESTGLGRWYWIDINKCDKKLRIISACQWVQSKTSQGSVFSKQWRYFLARDINTFPLNLFVENLRQLTAESIDLRL